MPLYFGHMGGRKIVYLDPGSCNKCVGISASFILSNVFGIVVDEVSWCGFRETYETVHALLTGIGTGKATRISGNHGCSF